MNPLPATGKRVRFQQDPLNPPPIYDDHHIFRVTSSRSQPIHRSDHNDQKSDLSVRSTPRCNWPDFMRKKIRHGE